MIFGNFIGRTKYKTTETIDGGKFSGVPWASALINGKGRYQDPQTGSYTTRLQLHFISQKGNWKLEKEHLAPVLFKTKS